MDFETNILPVRTQDIINFHCQQCGRCCRHVKDSVMVTPLDAFRLVKFFNGKGRQYTDILELYTQFCEPIVLTEEGYAIFVLKTKGPGDACIFLEGNRCTVYGAHPYTCRLYPFTVEYGRNGRSFEYFLCTELPHHWAGGRIHVGNWLQNHFTREDKEYIKAETAFIPLLGEAIRSLPEGKRDRLVSLMVYHLYSGYDLNQPFMPQYRAHTKRLLHAIETLP